jgi:cephalosporin-C deacetylase-like acetyl esterase
MRLLCHLLPLLLACFAVQFALAQSTPSQNRRQAYLQQLLPLLTPPKPNAAPVTFHDRTWPDWQKSTGELPPDFGQLPSLPFLPDPLVLDEGGRSTPVTSPAQWQQKRAWIKEQVQHWLTGTFPAAPTNLKARVLEEKTVAGGAKVQTVELRFGPEERATLTLELLLPPGPGPHPVFLTQWNHRGWAEIALRRGYIGAVYAGADSKDDTEAYAALYPDHDFTALMRRAWGAMRAVDYLHTLPYVDTARIALTGHSRNAKQSLMAAAFDERIKAVISSSGGTGGENSFRFTDDRYDNETIDEISTNFPHWLHPRLRFFHGREHKLPIDQNLLMALVAPRALLLSSATTEHQGSPWGIEQNYHSLKRVYQLLGAEEKLAIRLRQGRHGTLARDIEAFVDFLDHVFGRKNGPPENTLFYNYTFAGWKAKSGENIDPLPYPEHRAGALLLNAKGRKIRSEAAWQEKKARLQDRLRWLLGEEPPGAGAKGPFSLQRPALSDDYLGAVLERDRVPGAGMLVIGPYNALADYQYGYLFYPQTADGKPQTRAKGKLPVVVLLHEYAYSTGFGRRSGGLIKQYLDQGVAVLTLDMLGFGSRIEEGDRFYDRYPRWSKMGKMVADVRASVDALQGLDFVDPTQVYLSGYALGGTVALFAAALDERVAGVSVTAAFTPLRTASPHVEGLRAYSHLHGLLPRLGFFQDHPRRLPIDFSEIISLVAPRPLLVLAPQLDRHADLEPVKTAMAEVQQVYSLLRVPGRLTVQYPLEVNKLNPEMQHEMVAWVAKAVR